MDFSNVAVEAMAYALPPEVVTSDAIEDRLSPLYERLNLPQGRLELMTGIRERRFWPEGFSASQASAEAGEALLAKGVAAEQRRSLRGERLRPNGAAFFIGHCRHCRHCRDIG